MGSAPLVTSAPEHVLEQWGAPEQLFVGFGRLPGNLDRLRAWPGLCSGARFGCSGVTPEHVFSVPGHVFSAPEQKIFLRATRENMFRKRVIIFGALKKFASHTGPHLGQVAVYHGRRVIRRVVYKIPAPVAA